MSKSGEKRTTKLHSLSMHVLVSVTDWQIQQHGAAVSYFFANIEKSKGEAELKGFGSSPMYSRGK